MYFYAQAGEGFYLAYGSRNTKLATFNPATGGNSGFAGAHWEDTYMPEGSELSWQVTDVFENGVAIGVQVKVWLKAPDAETETVVFDTFVSAEGHEKLFDSYYLCAETEGTGSNNVSQITNIKVERANKEN